MKILVVEDMDSVQYALRMLLEHLGHEVVGIVADGETVLRIYDKLQPDLVLMDVRIPIIDGLTCTSLLARRDPDVKVIIITAGHTTEREARAAGACGFVEKPFELSRLDELIHKLANNRKPNVR